MPNPKIKSRWNVLTRMGPGAENCWYDDATLVTFATQKEAHVALREHLDDGYQAVRDGRMSDVPNWGDFIVERVKPWTIKLQLLML